MTSAEQTRPGFAASAAAQWVVVAPVRALHALMDAPSLVFLAALTVMLFRPPNVEFYSLDRVAFGLLIYTGLLRALMLRKPWSVYRRVTWPMLALLLLALAGIVNQPYEAQSWSLFAAKWVVPFALYHLAGLVFDDAASLRKFETWALVILAYLSFTAIAFLIGAKEFIFPRFILDQSIGLHADRARGPFLQAVANGVTLNLLGLLALDSFRRARLRGSIALVFLIALPLAILATRTRAVWLSFAVSVLALFLLSSNLRLRRACMCLLVAGAVSSLLVAGFGSPSTSLADRFSDRSPVDYRVAVYQAGWEMFTEKPFWGWSPVQVQPELSKRISGFHVEDFFLHDTYLEIAVEHGLLGLGLYLWMMADLFRLGRKHLPRAVLRGTPFVDRQFRHIWPVLVMVYLVNASFVVMNYQFVNGLLFTLAGILAGQNHRAELELDSLSS